MKKNYLFLLAFITFSLNIPTLFAVKAIPNPIVVVQPDGTPLTIRMYGDEFGHVRTTVDGYKLKKNAKGFLVYDLSSNKALPDIIARDISKRTPNEIQLLRNNATSINKSTINSLLKHTKTSAIKRVTSLQQSFPLTGTPKSLVILVNFSDSIFHVPTPQAAFTNLLNQSGYAINGGTGSARDYFMSASYGLFSPQFDVVGPYTLPQTLDYYGKNDSQDQDTNPQQMVIDACTQANNAGLDFKQYDVDNDGFVDNVFIYYAGYNEAEGAPENTIWPHRWSLPNYDTKFDGKTVFGYACTSELRGTSGVNMCGIGTFCHEYGHVLGLPDYYHTEQNKTTLDDWHIMDSGAYNNAGRTPPTYSVYDRFFLGWLTPEQISTASNITILPIYQGTTQPTNTNQQAYLLSETTHNGNGANPSPTEFFMLEYRKKTGWDYYLPAEGMLVWHIDYDAAAWDDNSPNNYTGNTQTAASHMRVYLQPLSGNTTTPGTAFSTGSFTPTTWSGTDINRAISSITKTTDNVTFKLMGGIPNESTTAQIKTGIIESSLAFTPTYLNATKVKTLNIKTTDLYGNLTISITGNNASLFQVSTTVVTKDDANLQAGTNITVSYKPTVIGLHTATLTISGGGLQAAKVIELSGEGKNY